MNEAIINDLDVLILFTMDVESPALADGRTSGPATAEEGGRRVREYADALAQHGYVPTYFVHPELGETQSDLFLDLQSRGAGLGLHLHTAKFAASPRSCELGGLTRDEQIEVLSSGRALFERYFGFCPRIFRSGCFSANDCTYGVLHELGFTGGVYSEEEDSGRNHAELLRNVVQQLAEERPGLKTVGIDVHNDRDFIDQQSTSAKQLHTLLTSLEPVLAQFGLRSVSATMEQAIKAFKRR